MQTLPAVKSPHAQRGQILTDAKDPGCAQLAASKLQWSFACSNTSTGHSSLSFPVCVCSTPPTLVHSLIHIPALTIHQSLHFVSTDFIQDPCNHSGERVGVDASPLGSSSAPICICSFPLSADGRASRSPDARRLLLHRQAKTLMPQLVSAPNYSPFSATHTGTNKLVQARTHTE